MTQPDRPELASHIISKKWYHPKPATASPGSSPATSPSSKNGKPNSKAALPGCGENAALRIVAKFRLDAFSPTAILRAPRQQPLSLFYTMARVCSIRGSRVRSGGRINRSGLAKKKGGIGRHVTKVVKRKVAPNLQSKRIWVPELNRWLRLTLSCKAIKTINKNGAHATLKEAGLI
jgi:large subunit ribosomal protein L28